MDLPKFDETKRLTCPGTLNIKEVIGFINGKMGFDKFIIPMLPPGTTYDPLKHIDITLPVIREAPAHGQPAKEEQISLNHAITLSSINYLLWPHSGFTVRDATFQLRYRSFALKKVQEDQNIQSAGNKL